MRRPGYWLALGAALAIVATADTSLARPASMDHPELMDVDSTFSPDSLNGGVTSSQAFAHAGRQYSSSSNGTTVTGTSTIVTTRTYMLPGFTTTYHTPYSSSIPYYIPGGTSTYPYTYFIPTSYYATTYRARLSQAGVWAGGTAAGSASGTRAVLRWSLYEPDTVSRGDDKLRVSQGKHAGLELRFSGSSSSTVRFTAVEGCNGTLKMNDTGTNWKFGCKRGVLTALGLTPTQSAAVEAIFGTKLRLRNASTGAGL